MSNNIAIYVYVAVSIITIGILTGFLIRCENKNCSAYKHNDHSGTEWTGERLRSYFYDKSDKKKDMCLCNGMANVICANRQERLKSYDDGNTEFAG